MGFRPLYPDRQVNNIYFDTPTLEEYYQNVAGVPQRRKHRLRWYGTQHQQLPQPVFEIKIKDGELGYKQSQASLCNVAWPDLRVHFQSIPAIQVLPLRPVLVNSYERSYWGSGNGKFRITIDRTLAFAPFAWQHPPSHLHRMEDTAIIMELKYAAEDDEQAQEVFQHLPFRLTKNSKYVTGIGLVMG